jgi:hypothetical protein
MKNPIHNEMIAVFHEWYMAEKELKFLWDAKQCSGIDYLYGKLVASCGANFPTDNATIEMLFKRLLSNLERADKWVYENVSPALLNSKYNEVVAKIKQQNKPKELKFDILKEMFE